MTPFNENVAAFVTLIQYYRSFLPFSFTQFQQLLIVNGTGHIALSYLQYMTNDAVITLQQLQYVAADAIMPLAGLETRHEAILAFRAHLCI